ncbi:hypothetical protein [Micromonospora sp. NPDC050200]|uniref:hypothetical protein n=1 Tax=Micromonospora sp. NPDC050200 TaxID=3155664 RepID=UPI0033F821BB
MTRSVPTVDEIRRTRSGRGDAPLPGRAVAPAARPAGSRARGSRSARFAVHR